MNGKRRTFLGALLGLGVFGLPSIAKTAPVLIFRISDGMFVDYLPSADTTAYAGRTDVVINPALPQGVPLRNIIVQNGTPRAMTQAERDARDTTELNAALNQQRVSAIELLQSDAALGRSTRALLEVIAQATGRTRAQVRSAFGAAVEGNV